MDLMWNKGKLKKENVLSYNSLFAYFRCCSSYNDKKVVERAKKYVFDNDVTARWALDAVYQSTDPDKAYTIGRFLQNKNEFNGTAIDYLVELEGEKVIEKLIPFLNDQNEALRSKVVETIKGIDWDIATAAFPDKEDDEES